MQLRGKLILLALLPLVVSLLLIALAVRHQERELAARERELVRATYMDARRTELRHYVDLAVSTVQPLYAGPQQGEAATRARALALLSSLDYGPDGYFFVYDLSGTVLMHSRQPELLGKNLWGLRDPRGQLTIQALIAQAKAGGGYVEYLWRKPSSEQMAAKLGYVVQLERWGWMLGTGLYLDGIESTMAELDRSASRNIATTLLWIAGIAVFGVALISASALALNLSEHRSAETKLRLLARQVVASQEDERAHLARELHDGVSQTLVSTKLLIESAAERVGEGAAARPLGQALARLNSSLTEVRRISHRLRPALLDTLGLPAALQHLAHEFDEAGPTPHDFVLQGQARELPEVVKTVLFRVGQEALTNAAKHAQAGRVALTLAFEPTGAVCLTVADDGRGFDVEAVQAHPELGLGLRSMRERLVSIGGRLELHASLGHGTQLEARVPAAALAKLAHP